MYLCNHLIDQDIKIKSRCNSNTKDYNSNQYCSWDASNCDEQDYVQQHKIEQT